MKLNLGLKVNLVVMAVLAVLLIAIIVVLNRGVQRLTVDTGRERVQQEVDIIQRQLDKAQQELATIAKLVATTPGLAPAVANRDVTRARAAMVVGAAAFGLTDIDLVDQSGTRLTLDDSTVNDSAQEDAQEDELITLGLLSINVTGIIVTEQELRLAAVAPLYNEAGQIIGALVVNRAIDGAFLDAVNFSRRDAYLALIHNQRILARTTTNALSTTDPLISAAILDPTATGQTLRGQPQIATELVLIDGVPHALAHIPVTIAGETRAVIGLLADVGRPIAFQTQLTNTLIGTFAVLALVAIGVMALFVRHGVSVPLQALQGVAERMARGDYQQRAVAKSTDEVSQLATAFNEMAATIGQQTHDLERQVERAQTAQQEAEAARAATAAQLATIEEQRSVIREMSVPILPLSDRALVMPLVGALDTERLRMVQEQALRWLERTSAHYLILDITGVPVVDTQVAQGLIQVVQAARLLGAKVVLVGIRPEVAQALVGLGVQLDGITTRSTLQSGIALALGQR